MISNLELVIRLLLSTLVGVSIGFERERNNRPAGLRTHTLVSLGATLITLISIYGFDEGDPTRLAAQIVSGIGFIGAGTILRTGNHIRGLTTAASLWVSAGIGIAIGTRSYLPAIITAVIVLITLVSLSNLEDKVALKSYNKIVIEAIDRPGLLGDIGNLFGSFYITIKDISIYENEENNEEKENYLISIYLSIKIPNNLNTSKIIQEIYQIENITNVIYEDENINRFEI